MCESTRSKIEGMCFESDEILMTCREHFGNILEAYWEHVGYHLDCHCIYGSFCTCFLSCFCCIRNVRPSVLSRGGMLQ